VLWIAYTLAHGAISGWYPCPFLNVTKLGYLLTLRNTGFVFLAALIVAVALKRLDHRLRTTPPGRFMQS
jgi:hypothetical protein